MIDPLKIQQRTSFLHTVPFYEHCGFARHRVLKNYIIEHYDHPIFEGGKQLIDKVVLRRRLDKSAQG